MKLSIALIIPFILTISCISNSNIKSTSTKTIEIELEELSFVTSLDETDTNLVLQSMSDQLKVGKSDVFITYKDTISYFDESTFTETVKIFTRQIPIKIKRVK